MAKSKVSLKTATPTTTTGNRSISAEMVAARTPAQKAAVRRRLNSYINEQVNAGRDRTQVEAGFKAAVNRISGGKKSYS